MEHGSEASALLKGSFEEELFLYKKQLRDYELECERCIFFKQHEWMLCLRRAIWGTAPKTPKGMLAFSPLLLGVTLVEILGKHC